ncbi:MAG: O-antigen ligase family protein, partial [Acidobacteriota bacterium]
SSRGLRLGEVRLRWTGLGVPALLILAVILVQLVPIPSAVRGAFSPGMAALETPVDVVLTGDGPAGDPHRWAPVSLRPGQTLDAFLLLLAYMALFLMVFNLVDSRESLVRICRDLVILGALVAMVGLVQDLSGTERIFAMKTLRFGGAPYGPFINHNNFAGLMEMTLPIGFGLLLRRVLRPPEARPQGAPSEPAGPGSTARRLLDGNVEPRGARSGQIVLLGLALAIMLAALLRSLSRGGLLSLMAATALVVLLLMLSGRLGRWEVGVLVAVVAAGAALFLWMGPGEALDHFRQAESLGNEPSLVQRTMVWGSTMKLFEDFPVLGVGLGAYAPAFLHYYPSGTMNLWLQAHNDYVQILAEIGIVGTAVVAYGLIVFLLRIFAALVSSREPVRERFLYYGLVTGILAILFHAVVEFNLQVPANAAFFVVLCALALAQRNRFRRTRTPEVTP